MAPLGTQIYAVTASVAPHGAATESTTWLTTGMGAGFAAGSALGGALVGAGGTQPATGWRWPGCSPRCCRSWARSRCGRRSRRPSYLAPMDVAAGLSRLGTEGAFRCSPAPGARGGRAGRRAPGDRPAGLRHAGARQGGGRGGAGRRGMTGYCPAAGLPELRAAAAEHSPPPAGSPWRPRPCWSPRRQAVPVLHRAGGVRAGRRGRAARPGVPDLRERRPLGGRRAGRVPRRRGAGGRAESPHQAGDAQLAEQPDRRGDERGRDRGAAEAIAGTDAWVLSDEVYRRFLYEGRSRASRRCPGCSSAPSCSTAARRRTR